jgi:hypothetical protein
METFLNLLWLAIAITALLTTRRRSTRVLLALGCFLALIFPMVSLSDDLIADRDAAEETLAIVVAAVTLTIALVVVARVESVRYRHVPLLLIPLCDPRSPPTR